MQPLVFVLTGEFFSFSNVSNKEDYQVIENGVNSFLAILNKFKYFKDHCYWIFVPGMHDLGFDFLPRKPFPKTFLSKLEESIPHFINGTNPMKFTLLGKECVISKCNLLKEFRRGQIAPSMKKGKESGQAKQLINTILSQGHLAPMSNFK